MASTSRSPVSERADLALVNHRRRTKQSQFSPLSRRLLSTAVALVLLGVVLRYMPHGSRKLSVQAARGVAQVSPADLRLSGVQISQPPAGGALYVDGLVTNEGSGRVTAATVEVQFHDAQGNLIGAVQRLPMVGMAHGGTDLIDNELARNPIKPKEMRFFRVATEGVPPAWNHEIPELTIVDVRAR